MKIKFVQLVLILLVIRPISLSGQRGYYSTDSTTIYGIKLIDGGARSNAKTCQVKLKNLTIRYSPSEVKEYGFKNGSVYISKKIELFDSSQLVFLERLIKGETNLYYYKGQHSGTYFIEKDSSFFTELPKNKDSINFRNILSDLTKDCDNLNDASRLVTYKRTALVRYLKRYNACKLKPFPFFRYGLVLGYKMTTLVPSSSMVVEDIYLFDYKYDGGITLGLFIDYPIMVSDFSFHAEVYFSSNGYSYNYRDLNKDLDILINTTSLNIPMLLRYTLPTLKMRPFLDVGGLYSLQMKNENAIYSSTIKNDIIYINEITSSSLISNHEIGYSLGCGIQWNINYKNSIFFEFRYNNMVHNPSPESFGKREIQLQTGFNF